MRSLSWLTDSPYACPILRAVQGFLPGYRWRYGCDGWVLLEGPHSRARSIFPMWLCRLEARLWRTGLGIRARGRAGNLQREYRIRTDREIRRLQEIRRP